MKRWAGAILVTAAISKPVAGFLAGLALGGEIFSMNRGGIPAFVPWLVSGKLAVDAAKCYSNSRSSKALSGLWLLASWAFANRTLRDSGLTWWIDLEWLLVAYVPALLLLKIPSAMVSSRTKIAREAGRSLLLAFAVPVLLFIHGPVALAQAAAFVIYSSVLLSASRSVQLLQGNAT